jgi:hypothetical protein
VFQPLAKYPLPLILVRKGKAMMDVREKQIRRDAKISLAFMLGLLVFGAGAGYYAGRETATASVRFELLPCND